MALKSTLPAMHDVELAALAAGGRRDAFGELVRRHGSAVRGLLRRMGAQAATADDLAQDAFLAAFEQITDFRGDGTFQAWVKRIAARLYVRHWRKAAHVDLLADTPEPDDAPRHDGEEGDAHRAALRIDLDEALKALAEPERLCVSLCYGGGLSHAEAAEALNTPLGTVKSHVKRGLDKLRRRLVSPEGDGGPTGQGWETRAHG